MTKPSTRFQAVFFDLDGTLVNSRQMLKRVLEELFENHAKAPLAKDEYLKYLGPPPEEIMAVIDPHRVDELMAEAVRLEHKYRSLEEVFPHVNEMVASLHQEGIRLAIVTSRSRVEMEAGMQHYPFSRFIKERICADDVVNPKPHPEGILAMLERLSITADQTLFIGDTHYDIQAGKRASVKTGAALWGPDGHKSLLADKPDYAFKHPEEIAGLCLG